MSESNSFSLTQQEFQTIVRTATSQGLTIGLFEKTPCVEGPGTYYTPATYFLGGFKDPYLRINSRMVDMGIGGDVLKIDRIAVTPGIATKKIFSNISKVSYSNLGLNLVNQRSSCILPVVGGQLQTSGSLDTLLNVSPDKKAEVTQLHDYTFSEEEVFNLLIQVVRVQLGGANMMILLNSHLKFKFGSDLLVYKLQKKNTSMHVLERFLKEVSLSFLRLYGVSREKSLFLTKTPGICGTNPLSFLSHLILRTDSRGYLSRKAFVQIDVKKVLEGQKDLLPVCVGLLTDLYSRETSASPSMLKRILSWDTLLEWLSHKEGDLSSDLIKFNREGLGDIKNLTPEVMEEYKKIIDCNLNPETSSTKFLPSDFFYQEFLKPWVY